MERTLTPGEVKQLEVIFQAMLEINPERRAKHSVEDFTISSFINRVKVVNHDIPNELIIDWYSIKVIEESIS